MMAIELWFLRVYVLTIDKTLRMFHFEENRPQQKLVLHNFLLTKILEMNPDLVHSAGEWSAKDNASASVEAHPLKFCSALLPMS